MKRGTPDHPKVAALCALLNIRKYEAVGILEMLWHFTAKYAPQGDIGKYTDKAIAAAVDWQRPTGAKGVTPECRLSDALVGAGWVDRHPVCRLVVHDWHEHSDQTLRRFLASRKLAFASEKLAAASLPLPVPLASSQKPEPTAPIPFPTLSSWQMDDTYSPFVAAWREVGEATGKPLLPEDFAEAHFKWGRLDFSQKTLAIDNLRKRLELGVWTGATDPQFIPLPKKYLELEYKRPVLAPRARDSPGPRPATVDRAVLAAEQRRKEMQQR